MDDLTSADLTTADERSYELLRAVRRAAAAPELAAEADAAMLAVQDLRRAISRLEGAYWSGGAETAMGRIYRRVVGEMMAATETVVAALVTRIPEDVA